jgi:hypothetical protein
MRIRGAKGPAFFPSVASPLLRSPAIKPDRLLEFRPVVERTTVPPRASAE